MRRIRIFDTTLRDGEQSPGVALTPEEKLAIAHQLARLGVDVIEAGFPIASPGDFEAVRRIAEEVRGPVIAALARAARPDIERAAEAIEPAEKKRIHTFIATSPIHMEKKLRLTPDEVVGRAVWAVEFAKGFVDDVEFSAEDAGRSDPDFLVRIFGEVIRAGATVINIPDTVGYQVPWQFAELVRYVIENTPGSDRVEWSVHCHDDLGLAVANSLAAVRVGATQVECTVNGIGERAGNASMEEIVMALYTRRDFFQAETGINTKELYRTSRLVSQLTGMLVPPNKAVVGQNAFAHESGIHQDGVLKDRQTYEIMNAELVGREAAVLVLGKHSGRHAFKKALEELGYTFSDEAIKQLFARFKEIADRKKQVTAEDLVALVEDARTKAPEHFKLIDLQVHSGTRLTPVATVHLKTPSGEVTEAATGDGPVDAVYKAIARAVEMQPVLEAYRIEATTGGAEALGEVVVRLRMGSVTVGGRGLAPDVVEASARAYLDALNKLVAGVGTREVVETP